MNFKDPISTFAYNLISLHHDIMWYIIIILSIVYWALYKIIKEYSWSNFNKIEGLIFYLYFKFITIILNKFYYFLINKLFILNINNNIKFKN